MKKKYVRVGFTQAQKNELWERWRRGEQMKSIGRELCKPSSSIFNHIRSTGGFTPIPRRRAALTLSLTEREEISRGLVAAQSIRSIAAMLRRAASTVNGPNPFFNHSTILTCCHSVVLVLAARE